MYGLKTAFLLRSIEIKAKRKWIGNYFFYRDEDCVYPTYGLEINGKYNLKNKNLTFSINSLSFAVYNVGLEKEIVSKYNKSCPGNLTKSEAGKPAVYTANKKDISNDECLKALGVGKREFTGGASFETHHPLGGVRSDELLQTIVDLTKNKNNTKYGYQWPLVRHNTRRCLTCVKIALSQFKFPPQLYVRNSTSLDGVWASVRCQKSNRGFWTTRLDKFDGNKFDLAFYQMDHTQKVSPHRCQSPLLELRAVGTLRRVGRSLQVPGGVVYELYMQHAYLTPRHKLYEQILNAAPKDTCGKDSWDVGKTQDVVATGGCSMIRYKIPPKGTGIQILARTVHDENRNEMYFGYGVDTKTGPLQYDYMTQSCSTYPVEMTTTPGPTYTTTVTTEATTTTEEVVNTEVVEAEILVKNNESKRPTSNAISLNAVVRTILAGLLLCWHAIWLA